MPFVLVVLWQIQKFYLKTSRQLRHMELESKGPLYTNFFESLAGMATIRAFGWTTDFQNRNNELLKMSQKPMFLLSAIQIWLQLVLDLVVTVLAIIVSTLAVTLRDKVDTGFVGLALFNLVSDHGHTSWFEDAKYLKF